MKSHGVVLENSVDYEAFNESGRKLNRQTLSYGHNAPANLEISHHCMKRLSQRRLSMDEIKIALDIGTYQYNAGALLVFVGKRNIPKEYKKFDTLNRLVGLNVLIGIDRPDRWTIITVYKNQKGYRDFKKKRKYHITNTRAA